MLNRQTTALLVIDVQGSLARIVENSEQVIANVQRCIRGARILDIPVICIEQYPEGLGLTVPEISELLTESALTKTTFSCCGSQQVTEALAQLNVSQLLVCGIESHVCVYQSVAGLLTQGFEVELITDAISSRTAANRQLGIDKMCHLGATLTSSEMCLFELTEDSASEHFRQILPLVR